LVGGPVCKYDTYVETERAQSDSAIYFITKNKILFQSQATLPELIIIVFGKIGVNNSFKVFE
jgi:hypothetical protein